MFLSYSNNIINENGYKSAVFDRIGEKGDAGIRGPMGPNGLPGRPGSTGAQGAKVYTVQCHVLFVR